jgi:hypothetical protein
MNLQTKSNIELLYKGSYQDNWLNRKLKRVGLNYSSSIGINKYSNKRYSDIELLHGEIESFTEDEVNTLNDRFTSLFLNNPKNIEFHQLKDDLSSFSIDYKISTSEIQKKLKSSIEGLVTNGVSGHKETQKIRLDNLRSELKILNTCIRERKPYKVTVDKTNRSLINSSIVEEHNTLVDTMLDILSKMKKLSYKQKDTKR